jgi:hypothetical protein
LGVLFYPTPHTRDLVYTKMPRIVRGSFYSYIWQHTKTRNYYRILAVARWSGEPTSLYSDLAPMIHYRDEDSYQVYVQPASRFFSKGRFTAVSRVIKHP